MRIAVVMLLVVSTISATGCQNICNSAQCLLAACSTAEPYLCTSNTPSRGSCSGDVWPFTQSCTACCDFRSCLLNCSTPCNPWECSSCPRTTSQTMCIVGSSAQQCSMVDNWSPAGGCMSCCDTSTCTGGPTPPPPPPTNPPILTPVPGWTESPTDFPPPTPLPVPPPATPVPGGRCAPCSTDQCSNPSFQCAQEAPFLCTTGSAAGACMSTPWDTSACDSCCDFQQCLPPAPTPYPSSPWDNVPQSQNCTATGSLPFGPNPAATEYGAIDVSNLGCKASVSEDCCGVVPRFNWVLAACHSDPAKRTSMACNHTFGNTSAAEIYYINAYQWNTVVGGWVMDPASSFQASTPGSILNFDALNLSLMTPGDHQDWDLKFGPTTDAQGTDGLGPPGMLFVLSARQLNWIAFFALNQITMNRGPGGERYPDNCWSSSAGEFDFLEAPFWAGIDLPQHHLYTTITSGTGRCLPVQKMVSKRFSRECSDPQCCQMCTCDDSEICVGDPRLVGYEKMSCIYPNQSIPEGMSTFTVDGDAAACGAYFSGVAGGSESTSFFANDTLTSTTEIIIAAVVDADGVTVYRWPSTDSAQASAVWPGIRKFDSDPSLIPRPAAAVSPHPPCTDVDALCSLHVPSCGDDCALISAGGSFGPTQLAGAYAAECARDSLNWWNVFESTNQTVNMRSNQLPMFVEVPTKPTILPFECTQCPQDVCQQLNRCNISTSYMCYQGDALDQCSEIPSYWPLSAHCSACCDVTSCATPCTETCSSTVCDTVACDPDLNPYVCETGPLGGACSSSSNFFPDQPGCYSCCNSKSCTPP